MNKEKAEAMIKRLRYSWAHLNLPDPADFNDIGKELQAIEEVINRHVNESERGRFEKGRTIMKRTVYVE